MEEQNLIINIKQEPKEDVDFLNIKTEEVVTKSLVLRFIRGRNGDYSVVPLIKPDPFYEENVDDLCTNMESVVDIKSEREHFGIKQETNENKDPEKNKSLDKKERKSNNVNLLISHCSKCSYTNIHRLVKRHTQRVHITKTKHACPFCRKKNFKEPLSLDAHILRQHREVKGAVKRIKRTIFECSFSFCTYKTLKRNNFLRHLTVHGEGSLKTHLENNKRLCRSESTDTLKMVLSINKYDCFHCPYSTKDKGSIIKHLRLHRDNSSWPYCCKACNKKFNEKNGLDAHIVKNHIENMELLQVVTNRVYECELCNYKDVNKNKVYRHKRARHVKKEKRAVVKSTIKIIKPRKSH